MLCLHLFQPVSLFSAAWGSMVCFCLVSMNHYNTAQMCENLSLRLLLQPAVAGEKVISVSHHTHVLCVTSTKISSQVPRPDSISSYPEQSPAYVKYLHKVADPLFVHAHSPTRHFPESLEAQCPQAFGTAIKINQNRFFFRFYPPVLLP